MAESNLCELRGKKPANRRASLFQQCRQSRLKTILTQTALFPVPSQQSGSIITRNGASVVLADEPGGPVALKHQSDSDFLEPREILLTVQSDSRSVEQGRTIAR